MRIVPFSRFRTPPIRIEKGPVYVQAPERFQPLVDQLYDRLLMEEDFLCELSARTGDPSPERWFWVRVVMACMEGRHTVRLIQPLLDPLLEEAAGKLNLGAHRERIIQEARNWYILGTGYPRIFHATFDTLFFWLPFRSSFRRAAFRAVGWVANLIPGDQRDVLALISETDVLLARAIAKRLRRLKRGVAFIDEEIAGLVEKFLAEM